MRITFYLCVALSFLLSGRVFALKEAADPADMMVLDKVSSDSRAIGLKRGQEMEGARRAEAEKKIETVRNIPPERVQDWIDGKLSGEELEKVVAQAQKKPVEVEMTMPSERVSRLALLSGAALFLAILYGVQRRRAHKASVKKGNDQDFGDSPKAATAHRTWTIKE
jgi:hypothetical protein